MHRSIRHSDGANQKFLLKIRSLARRIEMGPATGFGVLTRIWGLGSGAVTLLLIASRFSRELQGYYFTFSSLLALSVFLEMGLGQVILQFASHEWSQLGLSQERQIVGDPESLSRLVSLGQFSIRWFFVVGGLVAVGLGAAGLIFFSHSSQAGINWVAPWLALCILTAVNICLTPLWSLLDGCNQVDETYRFRFVSGCLSTFTIWVAILLGASLWTAALSTIVQLISAAVFLYRRFRHFFRPFLSPAKMGTVKWRAEILPLQWKIAISWLSGYLFFSLFTPALFKFQGAVAAGQMGMSWGIVNALSSISTTWILTKVPRFGVMVAIKDYKALDRLTFRSGVASTIVAFCGSIAIEGLVFLLYAFHHPLANRLLLPLPTGLFLIATVLMQISQAQSAYLRAHKKEPMMGLSVACGLLVCLLTLLLGRRFGATGMAAGYLSVVALIVLPIGTIIWSRCRAIWHAPENDSGSHKDHSVKS